MHARTHTHTCTRARAGALGAFNCHVIHILPVCADSSMVLYVWNRLGFQFCAVSHELGGQASLAAAGSHRLLTETEIKTMTRESDQRMKSFIIFFVMVAIVVTIIAILLILVGQRSLFSLWKLDFYLIIDSQTWELKTDWQQNVSVIISKISSKLTDKC